MNSSLSPSVVVMAGLASYQIAKKTRQPQERRSEEFALNLGEFRPVGPPRLRVFAEPRLCRFAAGAAGTPLSGAKFKRVGIPNTFSLAWRLGRVVRRAQVDATLGSVTNAIVAEVGGSTSARRLFMGKIGGVETKITDTGHSLGEVIIEKLADDEVEQGVDLGSPGDGWKEVRIPFMNENLAVIAKGDSGGENVSVSILSLASIGGRGPLLTIPVQVLATVPDLICLLDVSTGEAIGVQEYRYGIKVNVMVMAPHPVWTTKRGLEIAGPKAFQLSHEYSSTLVYNKPRSVIAEFASTSL
jgi:hypothetical protein